MQKRRWNGLFRLLIPLLLICSMAGFFGRQQGAQAQPAAITFNVLDARAGLLHITASGLPLQTTVWLVVTTRAVGEPSFVAQYIQQATSATGTLDFNDLVGIFMCGTNVQLFIQAPGSPQTQILPTIGPLTLAPINTIGQSPSLLAQCPATNPLIGITNLGGGAAQIGGQGFYPVESTVITVTSRLQGVLGTVTTQTDVHGILTASLPIGSLACGDTLSATATGSAGSTATSGGFIYSCIVPATPTPLPTPRVFLSSAPAPQPAHLTVHNSPTKVLPHRLETVSVDTGVPNALVHISFSAAGLHTVAFTARADNLGRARLTYMAPSILPAATVTVHYTVLFSAVAGPLSANGTFQLLRG